MEEKLIEVYGIKGFDKNLKCRGYDYLIGNTYDMPIDKVRLCNSGFHFSPNLYYSNKFYSKGYGSRYCIVQTFIPESKYKEWTAQKDKIVSNNITIIRELTSEEVNNYYKEEKELFGKPKVISPEEIYRLEELKVIQKAYPLFQVGGSVGLWLQGFNINRNKSVGDFDFVIPYYQRLDLSDFNPNDNVTEVDQMDNCKNSGNDFDYTNGININGNFMLMDMKINPKAKYININYDGFNYKVCPWEIIVAAKMRYLDTKTGKKHRQDLMDMFGTPKSPVKLVEEVKLTTFEQLIENEYRTK